MRYLRIVYFLQIAILLSVLSSCGNHLPSDEFANPATQGYHRMEFDIVKDGVTLKEIGIGNIYLKENQSLDNVYFKIYGLYQGVLYMKSDACGIDTSTRFNGITTFKLSDIVPNPEKCSIEITATTDKINNKEHNLVESGVLKLNIIPENTKPLGIEYTRTNSLLKNLFQTYRYTGQGSIQRQEGDLTSSEKFTVVTDLTSGGYFRVAGCGREKTGSFDKSSFDVSLKELYSKDFLKTTDTCDFEIILIPNEVIESYLGRFSVSIYGKDAVKLEPLEWEIHKNILGKRLYVWGGDHVLACSINEDVKTKNTHNVKYSSGTTYWIRSITSNARKSVFAIKDGEIVWKE